MQCEDFYLTSAQPEQQKNVEDNWGQLEIFEYELGNRGCLGIISNFIRYYNAHIF